VVTWILQDEELTIPIVGPDDDVNPTWCTGEVQAVGEPSRAAPSLDESLLCLEDPASLNDVTLLPMDYPILSQCRNEMFDSNLNAFYGLPDLNNVDLGTPPDLQLSVSLSLWCSCCQYFSSDGVTSKSEHVSLFCLATGHSVWLSGKHRWLAGPHLGW
jgi:hypothetical protein